MDEVAITIVGAGVVGLACAAILSKKYTDIIVVEQHDSFGQETSSRNSEVIHAGIYYPHSSLKARLCVEGKELLYDYCAKHGIAHKRMGKLIVAVEKEETGRLQELFQQGIRNGVNDLEMVSKDELYTYEPHVKGFGAIFSPSTGILDTHNFMKTLERQARSQQVMFCYSTKVVGIEQSGSRYIVSVEDGQETVFRFVSRVVINAAGLNSDKIASLCGLQNEEYKLKYCKGDYFRVHNNKARYVSHLIYPTPHTESAGLGIHTVSDLGGGLRLGPDTEYTSRIEYTIDGTKRERFYQECHELLPFIEVDDLFPDTSGIRPKLQGPQESVRDFVIKDESEQGDAGLINLIGIESPGLTASLAIGRRVFKLVEQYE